MECQYHKLKGRIVEKYNTQGDFARTIGLSKNSMSKKMTGKVGFTSAEIILWSELLGICKDEIGEFFFPDIPDHRE